MDIGTISLVLVLGMVVLLAIGMPLGLASASLAALCMVMKFEPTLLTDRVRLRQILANLLSNARKFRDPDELAPSIDVQVSRDGDAHVLLVSDNGIGMSEETAATAFDMFSRGSAEHPGHGLGLYIVAKHVERLGGTVRVASPRLPTCIEILLPSATPAERHGARIST